MRAGLWLGLSAIWLLFLGLGLGPLPALGPLLDFQTGVWPHEDFKWQNATLPGLKHKVFVAIDRNDVPHIFADDEADLYRAQGYIMASRRLFQIDLSSRAMSGQLGALVGSRGYAMDRFFTRFGMPEAERALHDHMMKDPETALMVDNFVAGINTYIKRLKDPPVEYKILGRKPAPLDTHIVSRMAETMTYSLSGLSYAPLLSHIRQKLKPAQILDLFPEFLPDAYEEPVFRSKSGSKRRPETSDLFQFETHIQNFPEIPHPPRFNGSNNWVVGPKKSVTGHSILANDTHLTLSLPNVWFENQLTCPSYNVYGVSFPEVPGIVNGFNAWTAWGPSNGATDALDYYEVEFADKKSLRYRDGEDWRTAEEHVEHLSSGEEIRVPWTRWGPVLYRENKYGLVVNWTGRRPTNELKALRELYTNRTAKGCLKALGEWSVPIQNFVCADQDHFGLIHAGYIARRKIGEGRFITAPSKTLAALSERVPPSAQPVAYDPPQGYVRAANERPTGPDYPYYLGWVFEDPFRARRIRQMLEAKPKLSGEDLIEIQRDSYDLQAEWVLPILLKTVKRDDLSEEQKHALSELTAWDKFVHANDTRPSLYKQWFWELKREIFADDYTLKERKNFYPRDARVAWMLKRVAENPDDSDAYWIDDQHTPKRETLSEIVTRAYLAAWKSLRHDFGHDRARWTWTRFLNTRLAHVAKIPGFGSELIPIDGASDSVRGNRGWHGAVYKFVIELGHEPRAWMQVPGGGSGDPLARAFEKDVAEWARGEMHAVEYYHNLDEARSRAVQVIEFQPESP